MVFPLLWLELQGVSPKADFCVLIADKELLLEQGLGKKAVKSEILVRFSALTLLEARWDF